MELKFDYSSRPDRVVNTFNRTAYGIEIRKRPLKGSNGLLLIAPLMELKLDKLKPLLSFIPLLIAPLMELKYR